MPPQGRALAGTLPALSEYIIDVYTWSLCRPQSLASCTAAFAFTSTTTVAAPPT